MGVIAGFSRGLLDTALGRLMDIILAFPQLLILLALSGGPDPAPRADLRPSPRNSPGSLYIILVLSVFGWPYLARIIRGQVLSLREREFVESAISMGAGTRRILFKEILPNLWAPILVYATILLPDLRRGRGGAVLPRRRPGPADPVVGRDARRVGHATSPSSRATCSSRAPTCSSSS